MPGRDRFVSLVAIVVEKNCRCEGVNLIQAPKVEIRVMIGWYRLVASIELTCVVTL